MILSRFKRFVLWGFRSPNHDSFRYVQAHYACVLEKLDKEVLWVEDQPKNRGLLEADDLVFAADITSHHLGHPVDDVSYVLHNFSPAHQIWDGLKEENLLRLQVYTNAAENYGVAWDPVRRYDRGARTLFQPWGTDLLVDEFKKPIFNPDSREVPFVGSIWDGDGQGNVHAITELKKILNAHRLVFRPFVQVTDEENINIVRSGRIAPAIAGAWQVEQDYLPCRVFKAPSYGVLAITNVPKFRELFKDCFFGWGSIAQIVTDVLALGESEYLDLVRAQQEVVARYTYKESLGAIERALEEGR